MTLTTENESTATAIVTVRVPRDSETDLATDAEARLARVDGVRGVTVDGLRGIEPRLSATAVTVEVTVDRTTTVADLRERLADSASVDAIESLEDAGS
jgi:hypothetical protein